MTIGNLLICLLTPFLSSFFFKFMGKVTIGNRCCYPRHRKEAWLLDDPHKNGNIKGRKQRLCCEAR
jgi:hypothetical protein